MPASNIREHILVMGQSNMDGRIAGPCPVANGSNILVDIEVYNPDAAIMAPWQYGVNCGADAQTDTRWVFDAYVLTQWRDHVGTPLSVIKNTKGGTSLRWDNSSGTWHSTLSDISNFYPKMYYRLISKIDAVRAIDARAGYVTKFPFVIWHQGESDNTDPVPYQSRLQTLIAKVRQLTWNPQLHWFSGSIPSNSTSYNATVFAAGQAIDAADPYFHFINLGAGTFIDGLHFDATYAQTVGGLYYNRMLTEL